MKEITKFQQRVYNLCSKVPKGRITTYKQIARAMKTKAYRAVGNALRNNPFVSEMSIISDHAQKSLISDTPKVPCHRVVASDGSLGGFDGKMNNPKKVKILKKEGIGVNNGKIVGFEKKLFEF